MTLKEKLQEEDVYINPHTFKLTKEGTEKFEKVAEEFAIDFANWINKHYWNDERPDVYYETISKLREGIFYNSKELLEIYKNEKDL